MHEVLSKFKQKSPKVSAQLMLAVMIVACIAGCTKVEPWDKANFTKPSMSLEPWSIPAYMNNKTLEKALESSRGSTSLGGGGCGCG